MIAGAGFEPRDLRVSHLSISFEIFLSRFSTEATKKVVLQHLRKGDLLGKRRFHTIWALRALQAAPPRCEYFYERCERFLNLTEKICSQ